MNIKNSKDIIKKSFISITKAAEILKVSPDTLRNWERQGRLIPVRTPGGARRYNSLELQALKKEIVPYKSKKKGLLSVSQAAESLGISNDTVRNWNNKGLIEAERSKGGVRRFTRDEILRVQKELGVTPKPVYQEVTKVTSKVTSNEPKTGIGISFWLIFNTFVLILLIIINVSLVLTTPKTVVDSQMDELSKKLEQALNSFDSAKKEILGIQTSLAQIDQIDVRDDEDLLEHEDVYYVTNNVIKEADFTTLDPLNLNEKGEIGCSKCLTTESDLTNLIESDGSITLQKDDRTVKLTLNTGSGYTWTSDQHFQGGLNLDGIADLEQNYTNNSTEAKVYLPANLEAKLSGIFSNGTTIIYGLRSSAVVSGISSGGTQTAYGGYFFASGEASGGASSKAVGLFASAQGADQNFAAVFDQGNVGIGTTSPTQAKLVIAQNEAGTNEALYIDSEQSMASQAVFSIETDALNGSGADTVKFKITADGSVFSDAGIYTSPADLAEMYPVVDDAAAGDVVELVSSMTDYGGYGIQKATKDATNRLFGVVSTKPGIVLGHSEGDGKIQHKPVALTGRVPVKVSLENGPIKIGDYLTASSVPGVAMKLLKSGMVIGQSLEEFDPAESHLLEDDGQEHLVDINYTFGQIMVFMRVSYIDPQNLSAAFQVDDQGNVIVDKLQVNDLSLKSVSGVKSNLAVLDSGQVFTEADTLISFSSNSKSLAQTDHFEVAGTIQSFQEQLAAQSKSLAKLTEDLEKMRSEVADYTLVQEASASASGEEEDLDDSHCEQDDLCLLDLTSPEVLQASVSAQLADLRVSETLSSEKMFTALEAKISDKLQVFGQSYLADTLIAGKLVVEGTMSFDGRSLNVMGMTECEQEEQLCGTMYIQNSPLAVKVDFFNGMVAIDKEGELIAKTVTADEFRVSAGTVSGSAKVKSGHKEVEVENSRVRQGSRILITPTSETDLVLAVTKKEHGVKFVVTTSKETENDLSFDWFIFGETEEKSESLSQL